MVESVGRNRRRGLLRQLVGIGRKLTRVSWRSCTDRRCFRRCGHSGVGISYVRHGKKASLDTACFLVCGKGPRRGEATRERRADAKWEKTRPRLCADGAELDCENW